MLLEVLSDFQISIPELGVIEAPHAPDRRPDLEQLARADRGAQAPLPLPVARLPGRRARDGDRPPARPRARRAAGAAAGRGDPHGPRSSTSRSRRRSPSRSTGRARCCCSAPTTSTATMFEQTMSIIVKHRTDIDLVAERVGVQLGRRGAGAERLDELHGAPAASSNRLELAAAATQLPTADRGASGLAPHRRLLRGAARRGRRRRHRGAARRVRGARRGRLDRARTTSARRWRRRSPSRRRTGASSSCSSTATSSAPPRRRRWSARSARSAATTAASGSTSTQLREAIRAGDRRGPRRRDARPARLAIAAFGRRARARAWSASTCSGSAARSACRPAEPRAATARRPPLEREQIQAFERHLRRELERALIERTAEAAALAAARRARPRAADEPDPGPRRRPPRGRPAQAPPGDARPRAARAPARRGRRHAPDDARLARDRRRAAAPALPAEAPAPAGDLRALRRLDLGHLGERLLPLGPARAPRLVPQAAQLRLHRADLGGHRGVRARARLPRDLARRSAARAASPTSPATPTTAASGSSSSTRSPTTSTRARP